jgi:hypothetical protein
MSRSRDWSARSLRRTARVSVWALCTSATVLSVAQTAQAEPNLTGQWVRVGRYPESFDAPASGPGPMMIDPAHPHRKSATPGGQSPDGWVADLGNPILKPETVARMKPIVAAEIEGHSHLKLNDLCYPSGVPMILNSRDPVQVLQSAGKVTIIYLRDAFARHIYLDQPHSASPGHTWFGESIGRYEGDTLMVDTIGENDRTFTDHFFTPHSDKIHTVERYQVSPDRKTLRVLFTVDDPETFAMPWSAQAIYRADASPYEEIACAENNRDFGLGLMREEHPIAGHPVAPPIAAKPDF